MTGFEIYYLLGLAWCIATFAINFNKPKSREELKSLAVNARDDVGLPVPVFSLIMAVLIVVILGLAALVWPLLIIVRTVTYFKEKKESKPNNLP